MNDLRTAAQQALEAMRRAVPTGEITLVDWMKANHDLEAALAEPVQDHFPDATKMVREPVQKTEMRRCPRCWEPMFPPQRTPLTGEEIQELSQQHKFDSRMEKFVRIVEAAHGIK